MGTYAGTYAGRIGPQHLDGWDTVMHEGKAHRLSDVIGTVQRHDIGKLMFVTRGVLQVENEEQFTERKAAEAEESVTLDNLRRDIMRWQRESFDLAQCGPYDKYRAAHEAEAAGLLSLLAPFLSNKAGELVPEHPYDYTHGKPSREDLRLWASHIVERHARLDPDLALALGIMAEGDDSADEHEASITTVHDLRRALDLATSDPPPMSAELAGVLDQAARKGRGRHRGRPQR